jgi:hypothetical protein
MLPSLIVVAVIAAVPVILVVAVLLLLGTAVAGLADGVTNGLVRPNPS